LSLSEGTREKRLWVKDPEVSHKALELVKPVLSFRCGQSI
jgi:hypothetical protein